MAAARRIGTPGYSVGEALEAAEQLPAGERRTNRRVVAEPSDTPLECLPCWPHHRIDGLAMAGGAETVEALEVAPPPTCLARCTGTGQ